MTNKSEQPITSKQIIGVIIFVPIIFLIMYLNYDDSKSSNSETLTEKLERIEKSQNERTAGKKPTEHPWDGVAIVIDDYLKVNLKDPDSLDIIECSSVFFNDGHWNQRVKYRSKNSLGGFVIANQIFSIKSNKVISVTNFN